MGGETILGEDTDFQFSGSRIRPKRRRIFITLFVTIFVLFPALSVIFSNAAFRTNYEGATALDDDYIADWEADDPKLIHHIRRHYLYKPSSRSEPYNLAYPNKKDWSHKRQSMIVDEILGGQTNGFFFEAGAYDGETYSNSLYFEKYLNWTGLLVEPDYANLKKMLDKKRKAWVVHGCLDGTPRPKKMKLTGAMDVGALDHYMTKSKQWFTRVWRPTKVTEVWCFPLLSLMLAVNQTNIDYMVLDLEGAEMAVLRAGPWDKLDVKVIQVEYMVFGGIYWDKNRSHRRKKELRDFMAKNMPEYTEYAIVFLDLIFKKTPKPPAR